MLVALVDRLRKYAFVRKFALPNWLDGQTIALLTLLTALGAMMQTGFTNIRSEMGELRSEMRGEMAQLRTEMAQLGAEMAQLRSEFRTDLRRLDDRLRSVEVDVAAINLRLTALEAHHDTTPDQLRR